MSPCTDVVGRTNHQLFPPRLADMYRANDVEALARRSAISVEEPAVHGNDVHVYASAKFPLLGSDGEPYAICAISTDITGRKLAEDEIKARGSRPSAPTGPRAISCRA